MHESKLVNRREFTLHSAMAILGGVAISVTACDSDSPTTPTPTSSDTVTGAVAANHGHSAVITAAQLTAADTISLDIQGTATHPHTVELTATEVQQIDDGAQVSKDSSVGDFDAHRHTVTFN